MADPRQRYADQTELMRLAADGSQSGLWTAMPGIIQSYDPAAQTVTVQPAITLDQRLPSGASVTAHRTILTDVPVQFPAGGGHGLTFPISPGDECLVVFASRCIDAWWQNGGVQRPIEPRMHDLSDGFALLGFRSKPRALAGVSTSTTQIRSDDGQTYVEINGGAKSVTLHSVATSILLDGAAGTVEVAAPSGMTVRAPLLACTGEVERGYTTGDAVRLGTHTHPSNGAPPTPGS